jgi:Ca-activated chloride channel family protein
MLRLLVLPQVIMVKVVPTNSVSPDEAATLAAQEGLKIYTVGIGSDQSGSRGIFGLSMPNTSLDEKTLKNIAEITGGKYFRARDTQEFQQIYHELDDLEPVEKALESWRPQTELFRWPLLISFMLFLLMLFIRKVIND